MEKTENDENMEIERSADTFVQFDFDHDAAWHYIADLCDHDGLDQHTLQHRDRTCGGADWFGKKKYRIGKTLPAECDYCRDARRLCA